jgi:hypothetical protein
MSASSAAAVALTPAAAAPRQRRPLNKHHHNVGTTGGAHATRAVHASHARARPTSSSSPSSSISRRTLALPPQALSEPEPEVESAAEKFVRESLAAETLETTTESPEDVVAALEEEVARLAAREAGPGAGRGVPFQ